MRARSAGPPTWLARFRPPASSGAAGIQVLGVGIEPAPLGGRPVLSPTVWNRRCESTEGWCLLQLTWNVDPAMWPRRRDQVRALLHKRPGDA